MGRAKSRPVENMVQQVGSLTRAPGGVIILNYMKPVSWPEILGT